MEAGRWEEAREAWLLARDQHSRLGRTADVERVEGALAGLPLPPSDELHPDA
jgi:hypothetical protein